MLVGDSYDDKRIYRGIEFSDGLPLVSRDLNEQSDTIAKKQSYLLNNLLGSGPINEPTIAIVDGNIRMSAEGSVVLIDGDVAVIKTSDSSGTIATASEISNAAVSGESTYMIAAVAWYQKLTSTSTMREYGGVMNNTLSNNLKYTALNIGVSNRYQLRWDKIIIPSSWYTSGNSFSFPLVRRDETGTSSGASDLVTAAASSNTVRTCDAPSSMTYAKDDILYLIPILQYNYSSSILSGSAPYKSSMKKIQNQGVLQLSQTPSSNSLTVYEEGTLLYNTSSQRFFVRVGNTFKPLAPYHRFTEYTNTITINATHVANRTSSYAVGISAYTQSDVRSGTSSCILQVSYNGVVLTKGYHYTMNTSAATPTVVLSGFTIEKDDTLHFKVYKIVESFS